MPKTNKSVQILIERDDTDFTLLITFNHTEHPNSESFANTTYVVTSNHPKEHLITITPEDHLLLRNKTYYVGILPYTKKVRRALKRKDYSLTFNSRYRSKLHYNITILMSECWSLTKGDYWSTNNCKVGRGSNAEFVQCICKHLSTFGVSHLMLPNYLDLSGLDRLFIKSDYNWLIVAFVSTCWTLFLLGLIGSCSKEKNDAFKRKVINIEDTIDGAIYEYLLSFETGLKSNSATTSKVYIKLHGHNIVSREIEMKCEDRKCFQVGSQDWFMFRTKAHLGEIVGLTLIIEFVGSSPYWYLKQMQLIDVTSGQFWIFLVNDWYRVNAGSRWSEEFIAPLTSNEFKRLGIVFKRRGLQDFRERHLWFSICNYPSISYVTRAQRLGIAFSSFLLAALVHILLVFFKVFDEKLKVFSKEDITILIFTFYLKPIYIGILSSLVTYPFTFLLYELFSFIEYPSKTRNIKCKNPNSEESDDSDDEFIYKDMKPSNLRVDMAEPVKSPATSEQEPISSESGMIKTPFERRLVKKPLNQKIRSTIYSSELKSGPAKGFMGNFWVYRENNFIPQTSKKGIASSKMSVSTGLHQNKKIAFCNYMFDEVDYRNPRPMGTYFDFTPRASPLIGLNKIISDNFESGGDHLEHAPKRFLNAKIEMVEQEEVRRLKMRGCSLPHCIVYIAWFIVIATSLACTIFLLYFGIFYDYHKGIHFLLSNMISLLFTVMILDPLQVLLYTLIMAYCIE